MPIYEYQCRNCSERFEMLVLKTTQVACPSCQSGDLDQLLSGFAVSSDGISAAHARTARQAAVNSRDHKDQKIAHAEYVKKHSDD